MSATSRLLVELWLKPLTCFREQNRSDLLHRYSQSFFTVEILYLWDGDFKFRHGSCPGIKEMPFIVFVKLLKSDQLPVFWGQKPTCDPCEDSGGQYITISVLQPFIFPPCDEAPSISATAGAEWGITGLQAQELRKACLRLCSQYSVIWALCAGGNSCSGKQLEGEKDRWRKLGARA